MGGAPPGIPQRFHRKTKGDLSPPSLFYCFFNFIESLEALIFIRNFTECKCAEMHNVYINMAKDLKYIFLGKDVW